MLPQGTVTFLFTDIEGSTRRWEDRPDAMRDALHRHDATMRECIERNRGVVFKTIGDAFCAAFWTAGEGVAAALEAQRAIAAQDWDAVDGLRVRMALHSGAAEERDGDYFGQDVNRVARLLAAGHGGQVLVSSSAARLVRGVLPEGASLRDLGEHRLKDLTNAEHVSQLDASGLRSEFPPIRSLDVTSNNLPVALTHLIGRERDVLEIEAALGESRLVSILGTGGVGKTRCALQCATDLLSEMTDGAWFVDLAAIRDASLAAGAIANALSLDPGNRDPLDAVVAHVKSRTLLLILDNCEHVVEETARCVETILRSAAGVRVLATSREPLGVAGESAYRLATLAVPPAGAALTPSEASAYGAIALFETRARAHDSKFAITAENVATVAEICRRLDGIALAIELAAARVKMLPVKALAQKLDERFRILTSSSRTALPRQQTMRALFDWSYDLLNERERTTFRRLSVFAGDFSLEQAAAVANDEPLEEFEAFDLIASLVEKSLLVTEPLEDETRYRLLESARQYAREKLGDGDEATSTSRAHANSMLEIAEQLSGGEEGTSQEGWTTRARLELDNWRVALAWAFAPAGDSMLGARLVSALVGALLMMSSTERERWLQAGIDALEGRDDARYLLARLLHARARLEMTLAKYSSSQATAERAIELFSTLDDPRRLALAQQAMGSSLVMLGRVAEGEPLIGKALVALRAVGHSRDLAYALQDLGTVRKVMGDIDGALRLYGESIDVLRTLGDDASLAPVIENLAELHHAAGDSAAAIADAEEAIAINSRNSIDDSVASVLCNLAAYLVALDRFDEARTRGRDGLVRARDGGLVVHATVVIQHLAAAAALRDDRPKEAMENAARLSGFVDQRLTALRATREFTEQRENDRLNGLLSGAFDEDELARLRSAGASWSDERAFQVAMDL